MSILIACVLAVLTAVIGIVLSPVLKGFLHGRGENITFLLGSLVSAAISSLLIAGGALFGKVNPGMLPNVGAGVLVWVFSSLVLIGWGCLILGMDGSDVLRRIILYGIVMACLAAIWVVASESRVGGPVRAVLKAANGVNASLYKQIAPRIFPDK